VSINQVVRFKTRFNGSSATAKNQKNQPDSIDVVAAVMLKF